MIPPEMGKLGFTWAVLLIFLSGALLLVEKHGSPEFFITVFTLILGLVFLAVVALVVRILGR